MELFSLLAPIPTEDILCMSPRLDLHTPVRTLCEDAEAVRTGDVYGAVRGTVHDGHSRIPRAILSGAACILLDDPTYVSLCDGANAPWILVTDVRALLLPMYLAAVGSPQDRICLYAVTGTNGKTSVAYLLEAILARIGPTACIGTVENRIRGEVLPASMTTPAPRDLARLLRLALDRGCKSVVMEASSHALDQKRLQSLCPLVGILTNLTEDHLDYHKTPAAYKEAKRTLFRQSEACLVNADDPFGEALQADPRLSSKTASYGMAPSAHYRIANLACGYPHGDTAYTLYTPKGPYSVRTPLEGSFAVYNTAAALSCAHMAHIPMEAALEAVLTLRCIPGRLERILSTPFSVYIDYAHTPDALLRVLTGLRDRLTEGARLLLLFGCGGDREREKRPKMGAIAARYADFFILCEDNSRSEEPLEIIAEIEAGIPVGASYTVIPRRETAIKALLSLARPGDCVLLAGKGHETSLTDRQGTHPFSERDIVKAWAASHKETP